jgi:hypothetical protein
MTKKAYISINRNEVAKSGSWPIRVSVGKYGKPMKARSVEINGPSKLVVSTDKPAPWGARVWIEAKPSDVELFNE